MCDGDFLCDSAMGIIPINCIDRYKINGNSFIIQDIYKKYFTIVGRKGEHRECWLYTLLT